MSELDDLEVTKKKIELAKRKQDAAILQQIVEPLAEAIEELNSTIKLVSNKTKEEKPEPEYFDKELSKKVTDGINQVSQLISKLKAPTVDFSPINSLVDSLNSRNAELVKSLTALANVKSDSSGYDNLFKQVMLTVQKNNEFLQKGIAQIDYSKQFSDISEGIKELVNRPTSFNIKIERSSQYGSNLISSASIEPKK